MGKGVKGVGGGSIRDGLRGGECNGLGNFQDRPTLL